MKKFIIIFILLCFVFACSEKDKELNKIYSKITDIEPENDEIKNATPVDSNLPIVGFFHDKKSKADSDFYKVIFTDKAASYEVVLSAVPGVNSILKIYSSNKKLLFNINEQLVGESEKLWELIPRDDFVYLEVSEKNGSNEKIPYVINFNKKQENKTEETETNNIEEDANIIKLNETKKGYISPRDDIDFYKIVFDDEKNHDFSIEIESFSNLDIIFTVINKKTGKEKKINNFLYGGTEIFPFLSSSKGEYVVKVEGKISDVNKKDPLYYISVKELVKVSEKGKDTNFEQEFNDDSESVTDIISGNEVAGAFFPDNDEDWFKFDLYKKPISVDLSLSRLKGVDPIIEIYDVNKTLVTKINSNGKDNGEQLSLNNLEAGRYYLKVFAKESSLTIYKLYFFVRYE
jgi:hypothetical protein